MKKVSKILAISLISILPFQSIASAATVSHTTKYRVYQNDTILSEFSKVSNAIAYAKRYTDSYVEDIQSRKWMWNNFPRYKVYQYDSSQAAWEFNTLQEAITEAKKWSHASVRDMQSLGWVWNNYPHYQVYQGDITKNSWYFSDLHSAIATAKTLKNAHIIRLQDNHWIWNNVSAAEKKAEQNQAKIYQVYQLHYTRDEWKFSTIEEAIQEALHWSNSTVININSHATVYTNLKSYTVYQKNHPLDQFVSLEDAFAYAKKWDHSSIKFNNQEIWNNYAYYQVYQNNKWLGDYKQISSAIDYALKYDQSTIRTYDGKTFWDNENKLLFLGWNGSSSTSQIKNEVSQTQGLNMDSPTWFYMKDGYGRYTDKSKPDVVSYLKNSGISIYPLVSNQFNTHNTHLLLSNYNNQMYFIRHIVNRAAALGVDGLNIDFEAVSGSDRSRFTAFMQRFSNYAHSKGLKISIDLPRGDTKWNDQTAFDHAKLKDMVDYIITMTYDQHYSKSPIAGSVAGLPWTEEGIQQFLDYGIARNQLFLGVPFYVRQWKIDASGNLVDNKAILIKNIPDLINNKHATTTWDATYQQNRVEYMENGYTYVFWTENSDSLQRRLDLAKKYNLAGVAFWRLGYEGSDPWKSIIAKK